jgi:hypothetical protein
MRAFLKATVVTGALIFATGVPALAQGSSGSSTDSSTGTSATTGQESGKDVGSEKKAPNRSSENPGTASGSNSDQPQQPKAKDGYNERP